jgi:N6-L-threonylcarbamoyladenine synthase
MYQTLGIDTSNYSTSAAIYSNDTIYQNKRLLPVANGNIGLRQSEALFLHVKTLGSVLKELMDKHNLVLNAVGTSYAPRQSDSSYMPCFLAGHMAAESISACLRIPLYCFSHQTGHIAAGIFGTDRQDLITNTFLAFHLSGGTTDVLLVEDLLNEKIIRIGGSADLHAGQLVDRVGNMLGLPFPSGPLLDALSLKSSKEYSVKPSIKDGMVCLSGIENQCRTMFNKMDEPCDIAKFAIQSIQAAVFVMIELATKQTKTKDLLFVGGVMSNTLLRKAVQLCHHGIVASPEYSADNAVGIAMLASLCLKNEVKSQWQ